MKPSIGSLHTITFIPDSSIWAQSADRLLGTHGILVAAGVRIVTLRMTEGPYTGNTITLHGGEIRPYLPEPPFCGECGDSCETYPEDTSFAYSGTHCTFGRSGIHHPPGDGQPLSSCCDAHCFWEPEGTTPYTQEDATPNPY